MRAARTDFIAARRWIPRSVSPFDTSINARHTKNLPFKQPL